MSENPFATPVDSERAGLRWPFFLKLAGVLFMFLLPVVLLLLPAVGSRESPHRTQCRNNLKEIMLALHNYHDVYGSWPPAFTVDQHGQPLHSWRTLILPFLERNDLYRRIDLSKPWNDPVNVALYDKMPSVYQCPSSKAASPLTTYLGNAGEHGCFSAPAPRMLADITDGTSKTLMVVEVSKSLAVPWMSPQDADADLLLSQLNSLHRSHASRFNAALADGSVRYIADDIAEATLRSLMTINGDESIPDF